MRAMYIPMYTLQMKLKRHVTWAVVESIEV
jgi:hypothetical protein